MTAEKARSVLLEEESRTKIDPQDVPAVTAVRRKSMCNYCKRPGHVDANYWNKHDKSDWAKIKEQECKPKKRDDRYGTP